MLFCHFDEKIKKKLILSYSIRYFVSITALFFYVIGTGKTVIVTNMFEKAHYKNTIIQGLIFRVLLEI